MIDRNNDRKTALWKKYIPAAIIQNKIAAAHPNIVAVWFHGKLKEYQIFFISIEIVLPYQRYLREFIWYKKMFGDNLSSIGKIAINPVRYSQHTRKQKIAGNHMFHHKICELFTFLPCIIKHWRTGCYFADTISRRKLEW